MIARVLWKRDKPGFAIAATFGAAFALLAIALDDLTRALAIPLHPGPLAFTLVAFSFLVLGIAPWIVPARRPKTARVACGEGSIRVDRTMIAAGDVDALSIARAARGLSIAVQRGPDVAFLEVDRDEDAARIARSLRRDRANQARVSPRGTSRALAVLQAVASASLVLSAPLYWLGAMGILRSDGKELFGIGGLLMSFIAVVVFVLRRKVKTLDGGRLGRGAFAVHAEMHRAADAPVLTAPSATASPLTRGEEPVRAWLERLDAMPTEEGAYRALPRDVLASVLSDDAAAADVRMAAARVLRRRYGEPASIVRVVADPEVRMRVEAAADGDVVEAEERIERLGPLFRAR